MWLNKKKKRQLKFVAYSKILRLCRFVQTKINKAREEWLEILPYNKKIPGLIPGGNLRDWSFCMMLASEVFIPHLRIIKNVL